MTAPDATPDKKTASRHFCKIGMKLFLATEQRSSYLCKHMSSTKTIRAYHFTGDTLRNGQPIPGIGKWLVHDGPVVPCASGLHASEHPYDALGYAPGPLLHLVELRGDLVPHGKPVDKWVGRERKIIASIDATELLRYYARLCAISVVDLWNAPDVVIDYLMTGDGRLRGAAREAAAKATKVAAWAAATEAATEAATGAAWAATGAAWAATGAAWAATAAAKVAGAEKDDAYPRNMFAQLVTESFNL